MTWTRGVREMPGPPRRPPTLAPDDVPAVVTYLPGPGKRVVVTHPLDPYHPAAIAARNRLRAKGYTVLDPSDVQPQQQPPQPKGAQR